MGISSGLQNVYVVDNKANVPHKIYYVVGNMYPQDIPVYLVETKYISWVTSSVQGLVCNIVMCCG